ncbi:MAG: UDP-N-acetylglucosamine--N-acetylmuramyl-(pentapeptide) pyrophosphoryl-undecaprenol N-acetylglucosamine transferase [Planctomycetes bacterium]|nr:UDP-N-acetylglucosamine--N-acetylmuramyl-(pentapeptide) pyrophosphoryl-undecaprenol N-acetylglucosamine transferase [Planctomycetota bacterium]
MPALTLTSTNAERSAAPRTGLRLALAGGGTGGHIVPGLHLLATATESAPEAIADLVWFTSGRAVEERVLAGLERASGRTPAERVPLPLEPEGGGAPSRSALVLRTPRAVVRARAALVQHQAEVVLGLGGFTALPVVLAARSLSIPVALLEINASPGAATRWLARFSKRVLHAWPATMHGAEATRNVLTGPPLAPEFARGAPSVETAARARAELGFDAGRPLLVVLGGSQGASGLNQFVRAHAPGMVASGVQVLHQTGPGRASEGLPAFTGYRAIEYVDPAWRALAASTAVLCRGGASTLAEVAALRRPAVVVPYPHHADHHQEKNAAELGDGVRVVVEERLGLSMRHELVRLCAPAGAAERARMSEALARAMPLDGSAKIRAELEALGRKR